MLRCRVRVRVRVRVSTIFNDPCVVIFPFLDYDPEYLPVSGPNIYPSELTAALHLVGPVTLQVDKMSRLSVEFYLNLCRFYGLC